MPERKYTSLKEFYTFYLKQHENTTSRILHFIGTGLVFATFISGLIFREWRFFIAIPILGYGFARFGHFFFEKNKPATFQYPGYSPASDFILFFELLTGKQPFKVKNIK